MRVNKMFQYFIVRKLVNIILLNLSNLNVANGNFSQSCQLLDGTLDRTAGIRKWPQGRIPYTLDSNMHDDAISKFEGAIESYHSKTCLRFERKLSSDSNYVHIKLDYDNTCCCGTAHLCMQGNGRQAVNIAPYCNWISLYVHELGHAVCLDHEHARPDRSKYLDFSQCTKPSTIEPIQDLETTRAQIYDYYSGMHYPCNDCVGRPSLPDVEKCGSDANPNGLSLIDSDRVNEVYNCQGCFRHRWYRVDQLTSPQEANLVNFAKYIDDHEPVYLCRGMISAFILTGTYIQSQRACEITAGGQSYWITQDIQLFGLSNGPNIITNMTNDFRLFPPNDDRNASNLVAMGRARNNDPMYASVWQFDDENGLKNVVLGYVYSIALGLGFFSYKNESESVSQEPDSPILFYNIGCQM